MRKNHKILILGESDFGLTLSLVEKFKIKPQNIVTTTYKDWNEHALTYGGQTVLYKIKLEKLKVNIEHRIDATSCGSSIFLLKKYHSFDRVLFTFPRTITENSCLKNMTIYNSINQQFLLSVSSNMKLVLNSGNSDAAIYYVVLSKQVSSWNIDAIAGKCGFKMNIPDLFVKSLFPKYELHTLNGKKLYRWYFFACIVKFSCW